MGGGETVHIIKQQPAKKKKKMLMSLSPGSTSSGTPCSSLAVVYDQLSAFLSFEREREGREGREGLGYRAG